MQDEFGNWVVCCVKGCDVPPISNGLCVNHLRRTQKYGSPVALKMATWLYRRFSDEERFWQQVLKGDGCWLWQSGKDLDGYGAFKAEHVGVTYTRAHRYSFVLHNGGVIPKGMNVCHSCDVPSCVRPDHLFLGTVAENMADKAAKGRARAPAGEKHMKAILTEEEARTILADPRPFTQLAAQYGVHPATISSLKRRESWGSLGPEKGVKGKRISARRGVSDTITPEIVRIIRSSQERGIDLAAQFGTTKQTITDIRKRRSWAHVLDEPATDTLL